MSTPVGFRAKPQGSLRRKLMGIVMASTGSALLLSAAALLLYEIRTYRADWVSDLTSQADLIAQSVAPTLVFDDPKAAQEALAGLRARAQILSATVFSATQTPFASYESAPFSARVSLDGLAADGARFDGDRLELWQPIQRDGEVLGTVFLRARHDVGSRIVDYIVILALAGGAGLLVAALIFRQLHPVITRPILAVADVSRRVIEDGDYELRVTERSDDEIGVLVEAFNNMMRDLSAEMRERYSAEEALRAADRRKDEFLATLAHELRNPLAPLATALAILKRADDDPALRESTRAMMERQLAQLVRLIDDLLEVSRITRGKLELRQEPVDLVVVVRAALEAADPALRDKAHRLSADLPDGPVWVHADAARLAQVFVNLLHNAAKYTDAGGRVEVGMGHEGPNAVVRVRDEGMGIDAADLESIFGMFVQLDTSLGRGTAGLGVGLTIARLLVELHGGSIHVESAGRGSGATFRVTLPTVPAPEVPALPPEPAAEAAALVRQVLVADDNVDFAESLASLLRLEGHEVRIEHDGLAALAALTESMPEVAFLDIGMPGIDGYELAIRLRAADPARRTVLVAVTGWGQASDKERAHEAGFDHHLVKPIDLGDVLNVLATLPASPHPTHRAALP